MSYLTGLTEVLGLRVRRTIIPVWQQQRSNIYLVLVVSMWYFGLFIVKEANHLRTVSWASETASTGLCELQQGRGETTVERQNGSRQPESPSDRLMYLTGMRVPVMCSCLESRGWLEPANLVVSQTLSLTICRGTLCKCFQFSLGLF